jgi:hypothetical protein
MPPSGRMMNWSDVVFTPDAGLPMTITGVTNGDYDPRARSITGSGDGDVGPSSINKTEEDPQFTVETEHLSLLQAIVPGSRGMLTARHNDANNGQGAGSMLYTFANVFVDNTPRGGRHKAYGTGRIIFRTWWPDGVTHPVSVTIET